MKTTFLSLLLIIFFSLDLFSQEWGNIVSWEGENHKYDVYHQRFSYGSTPFLITDIRTGQQYNRVESYEIRALDVYRPYNGSAYLESRPVVFFVHGGGWTDGYSFWYEFPAKTFTAEKGWILVSVDYRLVSDSVFIADEHCPDRQNCDTEKASKSAWYPANVIDIGEAFKWTILNINKHGGDHTKVFLMGHSAGGHLASLFAAHNDYTFYRPRMNAVISISGAYEMNELNKNVFGKALEQMFRGGYEDNDKELNDASPSFWVKNDSDIPPFYLCHCLQDIPSLPEQKIMFFNKLNILEKEVNEAFFEDYTHVSEMQAFESMSEEPAKKVIQYIEGFLETDVKEIQPPDDISLYPNPAFDVLNVNYPLENDFFPSEIIISNIFGEEITRSYPSLNERQKSFNINNLPAGLYFLKIISSNKVYIKKFIKS